MVDYKLILGRFRVPSYGEVESHDQTRTSLADRSSVKLLDVFLDEQEELTSYRANRLNE